MRQIGMISDVMMSNGELFSGEEISELVTEIVNKFAEKGLTVDKARIVLDKVKDVVGEYAVINPIGS